MANLLDTTNSTSSSTNQTYLDIVTSENVILQNLTQQLNTILQTQNYTLDSRQSAFSSYMLTMLASLQSQALFYGTIINRESSLITALLPSTIINWAKYIAYNPNLAVPSSTNLLITMPIMGYFTTTIPSGFSFQASNIPFANVYDTSISYTQSGVNIIQIRNGISQTIPYMIENTQNGMELSFLLLVQQVQTDTEEFNLPSLLPQQFYQYTITLPAQNSYNPQIISVQVMQNGTVFQNTNNIYSQTSLANAVEVLINSNTVTLTFGNGVFGAQPNPNNGPITVNLLTTYGSQGNVIAGAINAGDTLYTTNTNPPQVISYTCINTSDVTNGQDQETPDQIKTNAPNALSAMNRITSKTDFVNISSILNNNNILLSYPILKRSDLTTNSINLYTVLTYNNQIVPTNTIPVQLAPNQMQIQQFTTYTVINGRFQQVVWNANQTITAGSYVNINSQCYMAISNGTTGQTEPQWNPSNIIQDGTVQWQSVPCNLIGYFQETTWNANENITVSNYVNINGHYYVALNNGITGQNEPQWNPNGLTQDNNVVWQAVSNGHSWIIPFTISLNYDLNIGVYSYIPPTAQIVPQLNYQNNATQNVSFLQINYQSIQQQFTITSSTVTWPQVATTYTQTLTLYTPNRSFTYNQPTQTNVNNVINFTYTVPQDVLLSSNSFSLFCYENGALTVSYSGNIDLEIQLSNITYSYIRTINNIPTLLDVPVIEENYYNSLSPQDQINLQQTLVDNFIYLVNNENLRMMNVEVSGKLCCTLGQSTNTQFSTPDYYVTNIISSYSQLKPDSTYYAITDPVPTNDPLYNYAGQLAIWNGVNYTYLNVGEGTLIYNYADNQIYALTKTRWIVPTYKIPLQISVEVHTTRTDNQLVTDVQNAIMSYMNTLGIESSMYLSKIIDKVQDVDGVKYCRILQPSTDIIFRNVSKNIPASAFDTYTPEYIYTTPNNIQVVAIATT